MTNNRTVKRRDNPDGHKGSDRRKNSNATPVVYNPQKDYVDAPLVPTKDKFSWHIKAKFCQTAGWKMIKDNPKWLNVTLWQKGTIGPMSLKEADVRQRQEDKCYAELDSIRGRSDSHIAKM